MGQFIQLQQALGQVLSGPQTVDEVVDSVPCPPTAWRKARNGDNGIGYDGQPVWATASPAGIGGIAG